MIKRLAFQMFNKHRNNLKDTFDENKKIIEQYMTSQNKKIRNTVAGYVTRLMKTKELL